MTVSFYDAMAPYYKFLFQDWDASVTWHASVLDAVIQEFGGGGTRVLDVACGIGTQSIGLAKLGYQVTASDRSSGAIEQARVEAKRLKAHLDFKVADMRQAWDVHQQAFDVVIACDNAVPHLLNGAAICSAFRQFYRSTAPGGLCIISVRDYSQLERTPGHKKIVPRRVHTLEDRRVILLDVWDFYDQDHYEITMYLVEDHGEDGATTHVFREGRYYCVEIPALVRWFKDAGYQDVKVRRDRYFQPLLLARK